MSTSSDWSHFVICVHALKVREEAERTHIMIKGKSLAYYCVCPGGGGGGTVDFWSPNDNV